MILNSDLSLIAVFNTPVTLPADADACKSALSPHNSAYYLNNPIIEYMTAEHKPVYFSTDFVYTPTQDNLLWFRLEPATIAAIFDTTAFTNCKASILSLNSTHLYVFVLRLLLGNGSYWLVLQYVPGPGADLMFKLVAVGGN